MKTVFLMLLTTIATAQTIDFGLSLDVRNALIGSKPTNNKQAIDAIFTFDMVGYNDGVKLGLLYESFPKIGFSRYGFNVGHNFSLDSKWKVTPQIGLYDVQRDWSKTENDTKETSSICYSVANMLSYRLTEEWQVGLFTEIMNRTDLNNYYGGTNIRVSNYASIVYKIKI